jgi:hypothetical protein
VEDTGMKDAAEKDSAGCVSYQATKSSTVSVGNLTSNPPTADVAALVKGFVFYL